jgi:NRAMP (natural resistance-associated macrophage protein)-like metal ion transporter
MKFDRSGVSTSSGTKEAAQGKLDDSAVLDSAHVGDIIGAFGTVKVDDTRSSRSKGWRRLFTLLAIMGPGLVVMVGDNDAGGVATYAQAGQNYGPHLLWTLLLLIPVLYVNQEMVVRLGAVTGVGHARLIFNRFGKFWGAFSVIDLFILNALTIVTEFIGVDQAFRYFGLPSYLGIPVAAVLLFLFASGGSFRRWERWMYLLIAFNLAVIPMAIFVHPNYGQVVSNTIIPSFPGGINASLLLLIIAIVGTTVAPWQLFFQQSNVIDKRITPRWIPYERIDTAVGVVLTEIGAAALLIVPAYALAHTHAFGNFTSALGTAVSLRAHAGSVIGDLFALVLLDASLIGASAVTLSTTYALGDVFNIRHSLHWSPRRAPAFYLFYAALLVVSAVIVLIPHSPLGLITTGVQALAGILLPSATVFLVLLCNDRVVLGPWVNSVARNIVSGVIVWILVLLSLALTAATVFPNLTGTQLVQGLGVGALVGALGGVVLLVRGRLKSATYDRTTPSMKMDRAAVLKERENWRMPKLDKLARAEMSIGRKLGLGTLRAYLVLAFVMVIVKVVQLASGH